MEKLSELLTYYYALPSESKKNLTPLQKWEDTGMLDEIQDELLKAKIADAFDLAAKIIIEELENLNRFRNIECVAFPIIRTMFYKSEEKEGKCLYENFEFDKNKMIDFLFYLSDCFDLYNFRKYIDNEIFDIEAELCVFLAFVYVSNQNGIYKKQLRNKNV